MSTTQTEYIQDDLSNEENIQWSNLIFLPFHPVFKLVVLICVICKTTMGPILSVHQLIRCSHIMDNNIYLFVIKYFYMYMCDYIYFIDLFFHIVHRQVPDKAMRREHLPKSAFLLLLDLIAIVPFFDLVMSKMCSPVQIWPNILAFNEFLVIYRIAEYFNLGTTHSLWKLFIGFTILLCLCLNGVASFFLLLTFHGFCDSCKQNTTFYDWRKFIIQKINQTDATFATHMYAFGYIVSYIVNYTFEEIRPSTVWEIFLATVFMICGYITEIFVILPKLFADAILRFRSIWMFHSHVNKIVGETRRRNPSHKAYTEVNKFYSLMWKKRRGIIGVPEIMDTLPKYLKFEIEQDLFWPVFYHSPTLRKTSTPFKRYVCNFFHLDYKLPGEKFFAGPHSHTYLYYLKSGIIQLISIDDGITPLLSVSSGTLLGDISFYVPPLKRRALVRCLTYCEVYYIPRCDMIRAIYKYPADRNLMIHLAKEKIDHARTLYACKKEFKGTDRVEDEGIDWIKRRWWEISEFIANYKKTDTLKNEGVSEIPPEEAVYHCSKYIGQLVLCKESQLQMHKSMFANVKFPWILIPQSVFGHAWHKIVLITVTIVLIIYPPCITKTEIPKWFVFVQYWTDFVYVADICISLITSVDMKENITVNFTTVLLTRCKSGSFILDILASLWIENIMILIGKRQYYYTCQFNRIIKIYMLFWSPTELRQFDINYNNIITTMYEILIGMGTLMYLKSYLIYILHKYVPEITSTYFFGQIYCHGKTNSSLKCDPEESDIFSVAVDYISNSYKFPSRSLTDLYIAIILSYIGYILFEFCKSRYLASLYLQYREMTSYQTFATNMKQYYEHHKIHHDLLRRLDKYLHCHWKYYHGIDVMKSNLLKNEPYDIYLKIHGEVAEKIIRESKAFAFIDPTLIRELACVGKFLIMPKNATLFLFGTESKNVSWIVHGYVKCEYNNADGELLNTYHEPGDIISFIPVLLRRPPLWTYTTCTECEIFYIKLHNFFKIIRRYPNEWLYFKTCIEEFQPIYDKIFDGYVKKHSDYQKKLQTRIFHAKPALDQGSFQDDRKEPSSNFMYIWMTIRMVTVIVAIISASLQGASGAVIRRPLMLISIFCDCLSYLDIILKCFVGYYDDRGILIYDKSKCFVHYLTRGFMLDIIGVLPWTNVIEIGITRKLTDNESMITYTCSKFAHLYIVLAYFDYIADIPIIKWKVVTTLIMFGSSHYLVNCCIEFRFDDNYQLVNMTRIETCGISDLVPLDTVPSVSQLHVLFVETLNMAQSGHLIYDLEHNVAVGLTALLLLTAHWFLTGYVLALLMLTYRSNTLFQHSVNQLRRFLDTEMVDKSLINKTMAHFSYWWRRTNGIDVHALLNERIGVGFKQDLGYYFFKRTLGALNSILQGGETFERQMAGSCTQQYCLPSEEIVREMDLSPFIYIVHRGKVAISKDGDKVAVLTKGGVFGQLSGINPRPVKISAIADGYADILLIPIKNFNEITTDEIKRRIAQHPHSIYDYMGTTKRFAENPYDTVRYILRGPKAIQLPWMEHDMKAENGTWYSKWLYLTWLIGPFTSAFIVLLLNTLPVYSRLKIIWILIVLDVLHLALIASEFYTTELTVVDDKCVRRKLGHRVFKKWRFYVNIISLIMPLITYINGHWTYQMARLLRLFLLYDTYVHFCTSFKSKQMALVTKFLILVLLVHAMTCGWIYVGCREKVFPIPVQDLAPKHEEIIDYNEWTLPNKREGDDEQVQRRLQQLRQRQQKQSWQRRHASTNGSGWVPAGASSHELTGGGSTQNSCARVTKYYETDEDGGYQMRPSFLVPVDWRADYIVALHYILSLHTSIWFETVITLNLQQTCYEILINFLVAIIDLWLISVAISTVYASCRELYQYDYGVYKLTSYLRHSGISPVLLETVKEYTTQLWERQRGNWLPELAQQCPQCLREDLFSALYMYHINQPPLFRQLPDYFKRQLVARVERVVVFPGKFIIQEGDIYPCIYFIHEGEVEKWHNNRKNDRKMVGLLKSNGYFGFLPGLFPNTPFQHTYYSRTVVDFVLLRYSHWQDLLTAYPEVTQMLYKGARELKNIYTTQKVHAHKV